MVAITSVGAPSVPPLAIPPVAEKPAPATDKSAPLQTKPASTSTTPYAQNRDRFLQMVDTIVNADGKAGIDDQVKAYNTYREMWLRDQLVGSDTELTEFCMFHDQIGNSEFGQRLNQVSEKVGKFVISAHEGGERVGIAHLQVFASLSEDDQKIYYTAQNGINYSGNHIYGDFDSYRNLLVKQAVEYAEYKNYNPGLASALTGIDSAQQGTDWSAKILAALKDQASGDTESKKANAQSDPANPSADADMAQALKILSESKTDWDQQVLSLFKVSADNDSKAKDDKAKDDKDRSNLAKVSSLPLSYKPGYLMDKEI